MVWAMIHLTLLYRLIPVAEPGIICLIPVISPVGLPVCTAGSPLPRLVIRSAAGLSRSLAGLAVHSSERPGLLAVPVHIGALLPSGILLSEMSLVLISAVIRTLLLFPAAVPMVPVLTHASGDLSRGILHAPSDPVRRTVDRVCNCLI